MTISTGSQIDQHVFSIDDVRTSWKCSSLPRTTGVQKIVVLSTPFSDRQRSAPRRSSMVD